MRAPQTSKEVTVLPGRIPLQPGETLLLRDRFRLSFAAFYLHADIALTDRMLYAARPGLFLGVLPSGTWRKGFPLETIASVAAWTGFEVPQLLIGGVIVAVGLGTMAQDGVPAAMILVLIGALLALYARKHAIAVTNTVGGTMYFHVASFESARTARFASRVSESIERLLGADPVATLASGADSAPAIPPR